MTEKPTTAISGRSLSMALLLTALLLSGLIHGLLDGRWSQAANFEMRASQLDQLPEKIGNWELVEQQPLANNVQAILQCYGSTNRVYMDSKTKQQVNVAVMYGPRGPIAVHTPEVCYDSVGTRRVTRREARTIQSSDFNHQLWSLQFARNRDGSEFEVWYGWTDGDRWHAARYPRFWMTESLYKIQLAGPVGEGSEQPCREFLEEFLPELEKALK